MNVGQNDNSASAASSSRGSASGGEKRFKTFAPQAPPPPVDISTSALPGIPRGPPLLSSNIVTRSGSLSPISRSSSSSSSDKSRSVPSATLTVQDQDEPRPSNIVMRPAQERESSEARLVSSIPTSDHEVIVRDGYKEDNSIVIKWDTDTSNILGFRIVYRLFGKPEFKEGPPLEPSEREFRIKNVPDNVSSTQWVISAWVTRVDMELQTNLPRVSIFAQGPGRARGRKWGPVGGWCAIPYPPKSPRQKFHFIISIFPKKNAS